MTKYTEIKSENGLIYLREDKLSEIADIDTIVFDCDGVLLDVRNAYNVAIAATTRYIVEAFTGTIIPEELFDSKLNHAYKRTGGFNNDWSHAYAVIMRILAELPDKELEELDKIAVESLQYASPRERFDYIAERVNPDIPVDGLYEKLSDFAAKLDESGIKKVDALLLPRIGENIKRAFNFPGKVGESIISTLFEELFAGLDLYRASFGLEPCFVETEKGIVEADEVIIREETLDELENLLSGPRFGVASGSMENTARHALKEIKDRFPQRSQYWHDVVDHDSKKLGKDNLHKPNPYPLVKAAEPYEPGKVLYIGDTMADYLTAENAGDKYLFAGVYSCVHSSEEALKGFLEMGSDIVAPTVNDIPLILRYARGESN